MCLVTHHHHRMFYLEGGSRSYTWVKNTLQRAGVVNKAPKRGVHRKRRERAPWPGMMLHQDGSQHQWVAGQYWDLIVTMDDATNEHYSMFFCDQEGTQQLAWGTGGDRAPGPVLLVVHRPRESLLAHARGGREGRQGPSNAVWPSAGAVGHRDDSGVFTRSQRALRAGLSHPPGSPGQRTGGRGYYR